MYKASLRKVGGSVMLAVPPALLDTLSLSAGSKVNLEIEGGRLMVKPNASPEYGLEELLAQCDFSLEMSAEEREWLDAPAVGRELI